MSEIENREVLEGSSRSISHFLNINNELAVTSIQVDPRRLRTNRRRLRGSRVSHAAPIRGRCGERVAGWFVRLKITVNSQREIPHPSFFSFFNDEFCSGSRDGGFSSLELEGSLDMKPEEEISPSVGGKGAGGSSPSPPSITV